MLTGELASRLAYIPGLEERNGKKIPLIKEGQLELQEIFM